jgi:hypothetical protein
MAKNKPRKTRKPKVQPPKPHWRWWDDESIIGRSKELWPTAPSLNPNPHTVHLAVHENVPEAWAILNSYRLLITPTVVSTGDFRALCIAGGEGVPF